MNGIVLIDQVDADLNYLVPMSDRPFTHTSARPDGGPPHNTRYESRRVLIRNARRTQRLFSLDEQGFALVSAPTSVEDFSDETAVRTAGYKEVERVIRDATGATRVVVFDHTLRRRAPGKPPLSSGRQPTSPTTREPAGRVHNDYTDKSGPQRVRDLMGSTADALLQRRFAIVNLWRPIQHAAFDAPLAFCDARSIAQDDLVASDVIYPDRIGENYNATFSPSHAWFYFPRMAVDEAALIKCYDSAEDGSARFTLHTAFEDPTTPIVAPPRQSIEFRTLVFFDT